MAARPRPLLSAHQKARRKINKILQREGNYGDGWSGEYAAYGLRRGPKPKYVSQWAGNVPALLDDKFRLVLTLELGDDLKTIEDIALALNAAAATIAMRAEQDPEVHDSSRIYVGERNDVVEVGAWQIRYFPDHEYRNG